MDLLECAAEDAVRLFAGRVVESFHRSYDRSFRTPAAWIGVRVEPSRHDVFTSTVLDGHQIPPRPRSAAHARFLRRGRNT
jgi:hypothetical protein